MSDITTTDFKRGLQFASERGRKTRRVREKIHRAYIDYITDDVSESDAIQFCIERFSDEHADASGYALTERILHNIIERPVGSVTDSLTEAKIVRNTEQLCADLEDAKERLQAEIDDLEMRRAAGDQFVVVKRVSGGKMGTTEEEIPIFDALMRLVKEQLELYKRFDARLSLLMPKKDGLNIIIGDNSKVSMIGDDDLRKMIDARETRLGKRVRDVTDVS